MENWETVLTEWVNCLQLSTPITDINDLRNGDFFCNLLQVISRDEVIEESELLKIIFKTLKKQYPSCAFDNKAVNLKNLDHTDILIITSLLMHYSCIFENRDVLTSPLCQKLSHNTQLCIKIFLEKLKNDMTKDSLFDVINECVTMKNLTRIDKNLEWITQENLSNSQSHSPLHEMLNTPAGYRRVHNIQEKDREINKLKKELENEHYEKLDILEELKLQQEKNEKIAKELTIKTAETKKLKKELMLALQEASPFKQDDHYSQDLLRRLKLEIKNLEEYVTQLQKENENIQNERDHLNDRVLKIESEFNMMQNKCLSTEVKHENLLEKYETQKLELKNLREYCEELSTLLDVFKSSNSNDSLMEESVANIEQKRRSLQAVSNENLANTVVEVQLIDAFKEINELKVLLKSTQDSNFLLEENLKSESKKLENLHKKYKDLQKQYQILLNEVSILHETQTALEENKVKLEEMTQTTTILTEKKLNLEKKVDSYQIQLKNIQDLLSNSEILVIEHTNQIKLLQENLQVLKDELAEKTSNCSHLEDENKQLSENLKNTLEKYEFSQQEIQDLKNQYNNFDHCVEEYLQKLEFLVYGNTKNSLNYEDKISVFSTVLNKLELDQKNEEDEKRVLLEKHSLQEVSISTLNKEIKQLKERETEILNEKYYLSENCTRMETKIHDINLLIDSYENKVKNLEIVISEMSKTIKEFEVLKTVIIDKDNAIKISEHEINHLNDSLAIVNKDLSEFKQKVIVLQNIEEKLNAKIIELNLQLSETQNSLTVCMNSKEELEKLVKKLEHENEQLNKQNHTINQEFFALKNSENSLLDENNNLKFTVDELREELNQTNYKLTEYEKMEIDLKTTIREMENYKEEMMKTLSSKTESEAEMQNMIFKCHDRENELKINLEKAMHDIEHYELNLQILKEEKIINEEKHLQKIKELMEEIEKHEDYILDIEKLLKNTFKHVSCLSKKMENIKLTNLNENIEKREELEKLINLFKMTLVNLDEDVVKLQTEIDNKVKMCEELNEQNSNFTIEKNNLNEECTDLKKQLEEKEKDYDCYLANLMQELDRFKTELEHKNLLINDLQEKVNVYEININKLSNEVQTIKNLKNIAEEKVLDLEKNKENLTKEYSDKIKELEETLRQYEESYSDLKIDNDKLSIREFQYLDELRNLKDELNEAMTKCTELLFNNQDLVVENEMQVSSLTENLHSLIAKYNLMELKHDDKVKEQNILQETFNKLREDYEKLSNKFSEQVICNSQIEVLIENEQQLKDRFLKAQIDFNKLKDDNCELNEQLRSCQKLYEQLKLDFSDFKNFHEHYVTNNEKVVTELKDEHSLIVSKLQDDKNLLENTVLEKQSQIDNLLSEKLQTNENFISKIEEQNNEIKENQFQIETLEQNISKITVLNSSLVKELEYFKEQMDCLQDAYNDEKNKCSKIEIERKLLEDAHLESKKRELELQCEARILKDQLKEMLIIKENNRKYEENMMAKDQHIQELITTIEEMKSDLTEKENLIKQLQENNYDACESLNNFKLLENEKNVHIRRVEVLENIITSLHKNYMILYEMLTKQFEIFKFNLKENRLKNENLTQIIENNFGNKLAIDQNKCVTRNLISKQCIEEFTNLLKSIHTECLDNFATLETLYHNSEELEKSTFSNFTHLFKETKNKLIYTHENIFKNCTELMDITCSEERQIDLELFLENLAILLQSENKNNENLETKILDIEEDNAKKTEILENLRYKLINLSSCLGIQNEKILNDNTSNINYVEFLLKEAEEKVLTLINENNEISKNMQLVEKHKNDVEANIENLKMQNNLLMTEKESLIKDYECLVTQNHKTEEELQKLDEEIKKLSQENSENLQKVKESMVLQVTTLEELNVLKKKDTQIIDFYNILIDSCKDIRSKLNSLISERNTLETVTTSLLQTHNSVQNKLCLPLDSRILNEKKQTLEILATDMSKQLEKKSKFLYKAFVNVFFNIENELSKNKNDFERNSDELQLLKLDFEGELEEVKDLKERANDILLQLTAFENSVDNVISSKSLKAPRESNFVQKNSLISEDEYKRKNVALKQKLTLAENAKANLEKKIKQLREENKKLTQKLQPENEILYKQLLEEHLKTKEEYERILKDCNSQYEELLKEYENCKSQKYGQVKTTLEVEDISNQEAYKQLFNEKCRLQMENETLQSLLREESSLSSNIDLIKENYTKILEENTKLKTELDTIKYKRSRDREEFSQVMSQEREKEAQKMQEIKNKYDSKLDLLKQKMIQMYNEELEKEHRKIVEGKTQNEQLLKMVKNLRDELDRANSKLSSLENSKKHEIENYPSKTSELYSSRESLHSVCTQDGYRESISRLRNNVNECKRGMQFQNENAARFKTSLDDVFSVPDTHTVVKRKVTEEKLYSTLPKSFGLGTIQEMALSRRTSVTSLQHPIGANLEMEDEDSDLFNNKYLADLKAGRCTLPTDKESNVNRLSELQWRNSLCPPHLKSSYPAETQFNSPSQFQDDDLKTGVLHFDDSMSTKLLPGDKTRKKDIGTTSYKKPGPPTPSKNGGRVSLQGNEIHQKEVLREHNENTKRSTPSRIKALFMGRSSISGRENSENQPGTPKSKRLSIFRRQK